MPGEFRNAAGIAMVAQACLPAVSPAFSRHRV